MLDLDILIFDLKEAGKSILEVCFDWVLVFLSLCLVDHPNEWFVLKNSGSLKLRILLCVPVL